MPHLENPFRQPILPPEQTDPEANAVLADTLLGKEYGDALRSLDGNTKSETPKLDDMGDMSLNEEERGMAEKSKEVSLLEAELIMGKEYFFGPKAIEQTFGFALENIPPIPFSVQELRKAKESNQILRLSWDAFPDGRKLTGQSMTDFLKGKQRDGASPLFEEHFNQDNSIFINETPRRGWSLVSNEIDYKNQDIFQQTNSLAEDIEDDPDFFSEFKERAKAWMRSDERTKILELWKDYDTNCQEISHILSESDFFKNTRDSFSEHVQYMLIHNKITGERLRKGDYYCTCSCSSTNHFLAIGYFAFDGARVRMSRPWTSEGLMGTSLSLRG